MNTTIWIQAFLVLAMVALSGFFSSAETAMTMVNRIHIQILADEGDRRARRLQKILSDPSKMLSAILIGNNIVNMAASSLLTTLVIHVLGNVFVGIFTGLLTLVILLFGEITPKTLASIKAEKIALSYAAPISFLMILLSPVIFLVSKLGNGVMAVLGVDPSQRSAPITVKEIRTMVSAGEEEGTLEVEETQMLNNVFDFGDSVAKDVMIPRIDITFVDVNATYEDLMTIFSEDMHTRFPVFEHDSDDIIGIINIKDIILYPRDSPDTPFSVRNILRPVFFTFAYKRTADLLLEMRRNQQSIAIVIDEYGSTAGLVTLEDLLEEIVGEIRDEYDEDEEEEIREIVKNKEYMVLGQTKLSDLNEQLGLDFSLEESDSIAGYVIERLDQLPAKVGDQVCPRDGIRIVVDKVEKNRISKVLLYLEDTSEAKS